MPTGAKKRKSPPPSTARKLLVLGHEITVKLACRETKGEYFVFEAVSPPGAGMPLHVHRHEDEFVRVLEGEFEYQLDQQIQKAIPGAMVIFPRDIPHAFRNIGAKPGRTFWTVMPGANFEKFFEELGSLPAGAEPDMGKVTEIFNRHDITILPPQ
jgi:quercetin dioxygenase-like cupin family protein